MNAHQRRIVRRRDNRDNIFQTPFNKPVNEKDFTLRVDTTRAKCVVTYHGDGLDFCEHPFLTWDEKLVAMGVIK